MRLTRVGEHSNPVVETFRIYGNRVIRLHLGISMSLIAEASVASGTYIKPRSDWWF